MAWRRSLIARILRGLALVALGIVLVVVINTLRRGHATMAPVPPPPNDAVEAAPVASHLRSAIRFKTISHEDPHDDVYVELDNLRSFLETTYPRVHRTLSREIIAGSALVYSWSGTDASLKPVLLAAHQDVVPIEPGTEDTWTHPPFEGTISDGFVWGRGARDDKGSLIAIFEAVEALIGSGFKPKRSVVLAFGFDEEVGGIGGAKKIAETFAAKGLRFEYVLDEGGMVTEGILADIASPLAIIGVTEKGFVTVELTVEMPTGHSSMPPATTSIGILAAAVDRLEHHPMPSRLTSMARQTFDTIAPELPFGKRLLVSNLWLFEPIILAAMTRQDAANASVRTTTAPTVFQAGIKDNVLPSTAHALINFRILPGDSVESVLAHVKETVADDRVHVKRGERIVSDPPPASSTDSRAFRLIEATVRQFFPRALVTPALVVGATDARHYTSLAEGVYHFAPFVVHKEDLPTIHGTNERQPVDELSWAVRFYMQLLRDGA
jgi:carboxypeptidase PM20D1